MKVPLLDPRRDLPHLAQPLTQAFVRVLQSGQYILGPEVEALETAMAQVVGVQHAVAVSNGTDALLMALMAQDIGVGDEVICPTYSFFATAGSIWRTGARPRFVDACPGCFNPLPEAVARAVGPRTRAIMVVHLFGQCAHMQSLTQVANDAQLPIIEDAAQALGARDGSAAAGSMGRVGCFSFFPSKNLGALGDAGLVVTDDALLAQRLRTLRVHGASRRYDHQVVGGNFRMDALQAAFLAAKLPGLDAAIAQRRANADAYDRWFELLLGDDAKRHSCLCRGQPLRPASEAKLWLPARPHGHHTFNQYVVRLPCGHDRDRLQAALSAQDIGSAIYYPIPLHRQACFAGPDGSLPAGSFAHAEAAAATSLALPIFAGLRPQELERVARVVARAAGQAPAAVPRPA